MRDRLFIAPRTTLFFKKKEVLYSLLSLKHRYVLITDENVCRLYAKTIQQQLQEKGITIFIIAIPAGEEGKNRETKHRIEEEMLAQGFGRETAVIALGGGMVLDIAGFVAATYCRGVEFISMPTTLLAMVDASIGGKVGVNTTQGKNLIGAFYPASMVLIDVAFLETLPNREWRNGYAEMIKYGLIASKELFNLLENQHALLHSICESIQIKKRTVEDDFRENGKRHILNFGHTIAHALEAVLAFRMDHGEAVAIGMAFESYLCMRLGFLTQSAYEAILALLRRHGFPITLPRGVTFQSLIAAMRKDKKAVRTLPRFVILNGIGSVFPCGGEYCMPIEKEILREAYAQFSRSSSR